MTEEFLMVNNRYRSVDVLRGVALVFMIINHLGQTFVGGNYQTPIGLLILATGIFPATLFYIVVGISIVLVNHRFQTQNAPASKVWYFQVARSLLITCMGYVFAVVMFGWGWWLDWSVLQLIGISIIICQLTLLVPVKYRLALSVFFIVGAPFLRLWLGYEAIVGTVGNLHYQPPHTVLDHVSAILATGKVPIFPWLACPILGTIIGETITVQRQHPRILISSTTAGSAGMLLLVPILMVLTGDTVTQYPLTNGFFLLSTGMSLLIVVIVVTIVDLWGRWNRTGQFFEINGQIALITYVAHHLFGPFWLGQILGLYHALEIIGLTVILALFFALSLGFAWVWLPFRQKHSSYYDIAVSYALLGLGFSVRYFLVLSGHWTY